MLDMNGLFVAISITLSLVGAFALGRNIGIEQERQRAARTRRRIEKARKAT